LVDPKDYIKQAKNDKRKNVICSASETDTLIDYYWNVLNEVKNLCGWLTFCYDAILHFVQNDRGKSSFFQSFSACLKTCFHWGLAMMSFYITQVRPYNS